MQPAAHARRLRHVRAPSPLHFPEEALVPETKRHLEIRTLLYLVLKTFSDRAAIGSDQFVYWSASDPSRCLAPDAFVRLDTPDTPFGSWKTWERGAPELAVEIVSEHDADPQTWAEKLGKYHELGVMELVAFDPEAAPGERLRVWDRIDGDLVERVVEGERSPCSVLGLHWVVVPAAGHPAALRLARTPDGAELVLTPEEAERRRAEAERRRAEAEGRRAETERRRAEAELAARASAERRIAELEAELRRRGG
ncbi:Uma2 family endonuclease [Sorangium sp. So ce861]|uniref:Uma2 family endonuclease n=1 Tax=Sorangium sp. So ce861 TaxID=3133323 RepID=UPI003F5DC5AF